MKSLKTKRETAKEKLYFLKCSIRVNERSVACLSLKKKIIINLTLLVGAVLISKYRYHYRA